MREVSLQYAYDVVLWHGDSESQNMFNEVIAEMYYIIKAHDLETKQKRAMRKKINAK
jgi:hypothetical protein